MQRLFAVPLLARVQAAAALAVPSSHRLLNPTVRHLRLYLAPSSSSVTVTGLPSQSVASTRRRGTPPHALPAAAEPAAQQSFADLGLSQGLQAAMEQQGLTQPTEIQVSGPAHWPLARVALCPS